MKQHRHLLILTFVSITILTNGQNPNGLFSNIDEINVTLGPNLSSLYNDNITNEIRQPKIGYTAQLGLSRAIGDKFSFRVNFLYERKGLKTKIQGSYYDATKDSTNCSCTTSIGFIVNETNLDYIILMPSIRFNPPNKKIYFDVGLFAGHLVKAKAKTTKLWDNTHYYTNAIDSFKKTDFGISISLGYKIIIRESTYLNIQLMDNWGILDSTSSDVITRTNALSFLIGLNFKIK